MTSEHTAAVLNELIETSHDGEKGYARAAKEVADPQLKSVLVEGAMRCREGARELELVVRELGLTPLTSGSVAGAMHRGWLELKAAATARDPHAILEECERGEDFAKARYAQALEEDLPPELRPLIERQYEGVCRNHDQVRSLRDAWSASPGRGPATAL
jgi:uncharacterized protein (TIGR02284 family)